MSELLTTSTFWAAVAAFGSMLSSFMIFRVQRRNLLEAARPEFELEGWDRHTGPAGEDFILIASIRNLGKGVGRRGSLFVEAGVERSVRSNPVIMSSLAANASHPGTTMLIDWAKVPRSHWGDKALTLTVTTHVFDSMSRRHETRHYLTVREGVTPKIPGECAPGVMINHVTHRSSPQWWLRLQRKAKIASSRFADLTWRRHQLKKAAQKQVTPPAPEM